MKELSKLLWISVFTASQQGSHNILFDYLELKITLRTFFQDARINEFHCHSPARIWSPKSTFAGLTRL